MRRKYNFETSVGVISVDVNDNSVFLDDGRPRNFLGEIIDTKEFPEKNFKNFISAIRIGNLEKEEIEKIEAAVESTLRDILKEKTLNIGNLLTLSY